jgi:small subunit ribosomal protein S5
MKGGKRMSFRVCVVIGDKKGRVAVALGKGADVTLAVNKAVNKSKKNIINVPIVNDTIPHQIYQKFGSAKILIKPVSQGRGVIAGGVVRVIMDLAGVKNISSKILGTSNKVNNAKCIILAFKNLKKTGFSSKAAKGEDKKEIQDSEIK